VAREFFDVGIADRAVTRMLMTAARPVDSREEANVTRTVASAWRGHCDKTDYLDISL
jgi:hypothetical protein